MIVFLTEGGGGIGLGHLSRCISLSQAFNYKGFKTCIIAQADSVVLANFSNINLIPWRDQIDRIDGYLSKASVVVVDSYLASKNLIDSINDEVDLCVFFDDFNRIEYPCNSIIINGALDAEAIYQEKKECCQYLLGVDYLQLNKAFWESNPIPINNIVKNIFISLGGLDSKKISERILPSILEYFPYLSINIVINRELELEESILENNNLRIYSKLKSIEMKNLMKKCDIAVVSGSVVLNECISLGIPSICLQTADNQKYVIESWSMKETVLYAGKYNDENIIQSLCDGINKFVNNKESRKIIQNNCLNNINKRSVFNIVKKILKESNL